MCGCIVAVFGVFWLGLTKYSEWLISNESLPLALLFGESLSLKFSYWKPTRSSSASSHQILVVCKVLQTDEIKRKQNLHYTQI